MIIGNKYRSVGKLKDRKDVSKDLLYLYNFAATYGNLLNFIKVDRIEELYDREQVENDKLKVGGSIYVCRWDWNGIPEEEEIVELKAKNEHCIKVITKNGHVNFDTAKKYYSGMFKWKNKKKFNWESKYQQNVDFREHYYED